MSHLVGCTLGIFRGMFGIFRGILKFLFMISRFLAEPWLGNTDYVDSENVSGCGLF